MCLLWKLKILAASEITFSLKHYNFLNKVEIAWNAVIILLSDVSLKCRLVCLKKLHFRREKKLKQKIKFNSFWLKVPTLPKL